MFEIIATHKVQLPGFSHVELWKIQNSPYAFSVQKRKYHRNLEIAINIELLIDYKIKIII